MVLPLLHSALMGLVEDIEFTSTKQYREVHLICTDHTRSGEIRIGKECEALDADAALLLGYLQSCNCQNLETIWLV